MLFGCMVDFVNYPTQVRLFKQIMISFLSNIKEEFHQFLDYVSLLRCPMVRDPFCLKGIKVSIGYLCSTRHDFIDASCAFTVSYMSCCLV